MAKVALIKPFTGLNLAVSQLSAELQRAGHDSLIVYLKDYYVAPRQELDKHRTTDLAGIVVAPRGRELTWNCHTDVSEREYELLFGVLREFEPDLVGFSLTSSGFELASEVTGRLKAALGVPVIWGGAGPTLEPERSLESADLVCVNEGEEVIVELAERLDLGRSLGGIPGVWRRDGGRIEKTSQRPLLDLEAIAAPDFARSRTLHLEDDTLTRDVYPTNLGRQYAIMTSRGCPFSCSFCIESVYQDMFGKKGSLRRRSVGTVIEELVAAKRDFGIRSVMFYDDVFTTHRKWLEEFSHCYRREVGLPFWCYTYPTTTRKEDIALLRDAGCVSMTMGIQSGSQRILNEYFNRPTPLGRAYEAMQIILDAGIQCFFDLITGVEFETEADVRATFEFLTGVPRGAKCVGFGYMTKFPTYGYTSRVTEQNVVHALTRDDYRYYHRLYLIALCDLPRSDKLALARDPLFRTRPDLLDGFLRQSMPFAFIPPEAEEQAHRADSPRALELGFAETTVRRPLPVGTAGGTAPEHPSAEPLPDVRRRLPMLG